MNLLKNEITDTPIPNMGLKLRFAAIDLAPNEQLETGFSVLDRERNLVRMDKLYRNDELILAIESLGPPSGTIVVIDMPKNLSLQGKWHQERLKMHALQRFNARGEDLSRFDTRGFKLAEALNEKGILTLLYFNYWARVNYDMLIPFRSRSPAGCRALQMVIDQQLGIRNLPSNLAPSSVLESMVGAYASWSLWAGKPGDHFKLFSDELGHSLMIPTGRPHLTMPPPQVPQTALRPVSKSNPGDPPGCG